MTLFKSDLSAGRRVNSVNRTPNTSAKAEGSSYPAFCWADGVWNRSNQ